MLQTILIIIGIAIIVILLTRKGRETGDGFRKALDFDEFDGANK